MEFLARKFSRAKWGDFEDIKKRRKITTKDVPADALSSCLRTKENKLSAWLCNLNDKENVKDIVLALATSPIYNEIERMHIITIPKEELEGLRLVLDHSPDKGDTVIIDLKQNHYDISKLNLSRLSDIAVLMLSKIKEGDGVWWHFFTKKEVKEILKKAISEKRINDEIFDKLSQKVKKELEN